MKWGKATNSTCHLCNEKPQTNRHILSNCRFPSQLERYKTRHNNILILLAGWMKALLITGYEICVDIASSGYSSINLIFQTSVRPDLIIYNNASISVLELTVCHELNLLKSKLNKQNKYKYLKMFLQPRFRNHIINVFTLEVSTLGFISDISKFCSMSKIPSLPRSVKKDIIISVLKDSFNIYRLRNDV